MISRRGVLIAGMLLPVWALAQGKVHRIGFLGARSRSTSSNPDPYYDAFARGMRELGYVDGRNLVIEWRFADGKYERLPGLATELVRMNLEVIATHGTASVQALRKATGTIPIVMAAVSDPLRSGFIASLARPGGNITGLHNLAVDLSEKMLELLKLVIPRLANVAVLLNPENTAHPAFLKQVRAAAQSLGIGVTELHAANATEIERAFASAAREQSGAILIAADAVYISHQRKFAELALKHRLASITTWREQVAVGGLMSYGQDIAQHYRRAATYVDKILKGAKPGELPVEQAQTFHLAINLRTAKALGITVSQELRFRADEVIE